MVINNNSNISNLEKMFLFIVFILIFKINNTFAQIITLPISLIDNTKIETIFNIDQTNNILNSWTEEVFSKKINDSIMNIKNSYNNYKVIQMRYICNPNCPNECATSAFNCYSGSGGGSVLSHPPGSYWKFQAKYISPKDEASWVFTDMIYCEVHAYNGAKTVYGDDYYYNDTVCPLDVIYFGEFKDVNSDGAADEAYDAFHNYYKINCSNRNVAISRCQMQCAPYYEMEKTMQLDSATILNSFSNTAFKQKIIEATAGITVKDIYDPNMIFE
ncbi:MAG: hypothetical protein LBU68_01505 [Rickettsiales bacterium]|jgi:hypothetical protein|nr:hypothetical protein [Rickettsiales bacterium]